MGLIGVRGRILTLDPEKPFFKNGLVIFDQNGYILDVTDLENGKKYSPEIIIGSERSIVIPGLVNTHNHIPMYLFRGIGLNLTGLEWLKKIWSMESCIKPWHIYWGALAGIAELLMTGTTLFGDMYFYEEEVARASRDAGIRASLSLGVIELFEGPPKHTIEESISFAENMGRGELVRGMIGVHALYSVTGDSVRKAAEASVEKNLRIHMHFAESMDEVRRVRDMYGSTPTEAAENLGLLKASPLLVHAVYVNDSDLELLAKRKPYISYCPSSIMAWGSGVARVLEMVERGIEVTIGTDGPLTSGWMDILLEMRIAIAVQSSKYSRPYALDPLDLLRSSILGGARALGWNDIGMLRKGYRADLVVLEPSIPTDLDDPSSVARAIVWLGGFSVREVFVNGRHVVSGGIVRSIDLGRVYDELLRARSDILSRCG